MYPPATLAVPAHSAYNNNYPQIPPQQQRHPSEWSTGLCNCGHRSLTCFCPCIAFGRIAEIIDRGSTARVVNGVLYALLMHGCSNSCYSYSYRTKLRAQFNLKEGPCGDCLVHVFCEHCALAQEYRELKNRGFDPALGWVVNMEMRATQGGIAITAPPMDQGMMRK